MQNTPKTPFKWKHQREAFIFHIYVCLTAHHLTLFETVFQQLWISKWLSWVFHENEKRFSGKNKAMEPYGPLFVSASKFNLPVFNKKNEDARGHKSSKYRKRKKDAVICCRISRIGNFSYESQLNSPVDATVKVKHAALKISQTDLIGTNQGNYERIFSLSANCDTFVGNELKCGNWSRINLILDRVTSQHYTMVMHDKTMNSILH